MRNTRALSSTLAVAVVAGTLSLVPLAAAVAAPSTGTTFDLPAYDGTFTGAAGNRHTNYRTDAGQGFTLADLGPAGQATFSTVVRADAAAANWTNDGELEAVGFVRQIAGETFVSNGDTFTGGNPLGTPQHDGDPVVFGQYNGGGAGNPFCANGKFFLNGNFVFGPGEECAIVNDDATQTAPVLGGAQRFTVTIDADGTWTGSVTPLDTNGNPIAAEGFIGAHADQQFSGTLPGDANTSFVPMIRLRAGDTSGAWSYNVRNSSLATTGWDNCPVTVDNATMTATLTGNCSTATTLVVPDGWTIDGAGHTITGTETAGTTFAGAVLQNSGASMNVRDLTIATTPDWNGDAKNSNGKLFGIRLLHASGELSHVTIDGISHGNGVNEGKGVFVDNQAGTAHKTVTMDHLTVSRYQKNGVDVRGDVSATLTNSTIGATASPTGAPLDGKIAGNSVVVAYGADAVISGNHITGNDWDGDSSTDATGVLAYQAGKVTVERNVLDGAGTDVAVDVEDSHSVTVQCNLLGRTADNNGGMDIWNTGVLASGTASLVVRDNTVTGFATDADGTANVVNQGRCAPATPTVAVSGITSTDAMVHWTPGTAIPYAPVTGWELAGPSGSIDLPAGVTSYHLIGLQAGHAYPVSVRAVNVSGHGGWAGSLLTTTPTPGPVVHAATLTSPRTVVYGAKASVRGRLTSNGVGAPATTVTLWKLDTGRWVKVGTAITAADGTWTRAFTPNRTVAVRATATGFPTGIGTVIVASKVTVKTKSLTASVRVSPNLAGTIAALQKHSGSTWVTVARAKLSSKSTATFVAKSKGYYRVVVHAARDIAQGTSATVILKK